MLSACATPATPRIADTSCTAFKSISYAIPPKQLDGTRAMADDPENRYDTIETVADVAEHNARWEALCRK
jgi:hypothetical protein